MRRSLIQVISLWVLVLGAVLLVAARVQNTESNRPLQTSTDKAIEAVRLINAAEYNYRTSYGHFASWAEVYASTANKELLRTWPRIEELSVAASDETIPGFRLTLLIGEEGGAYSVALREMKGNGCGISVFSDQSGLIYEGKVVECPQIVDHPEAAVR